MNNKKRAEIIKTGLLISALVIFVVIAILQIYSMMDITEDSDRIVLGVSGNGDETFGSSLKGSPVPVGDMMALVTGGNFTVIDKNGDNKTDEAFTLSDPLINARGNYCIAADFGGNVARLYEKGKKISEVTTEGSIISVVTNANGFFAVASKEAGYEAVIVVHRRDGEAIYRYHIADKTFVGMDISSNNRMLAIIEANLGAGTLGSSVVTIEFNRKEAEQVFYVKSNLYVGVHFNKNGSFVCLGNESTDIYRADGTLQAKIDYEGKTLVASDITTDDMICLAFKGPGDNISGTAMLEIYDKNAKLRGNTNFNDEIEDIAVNGKCVAVAYGNVLEVMQYNCKGIKTFESTSPVRYGAPFTGGKTAVVFSGGNTTIMK